MKEYKRSCPECGEELKYSCLGNLNLAKKRNKPCMSCSKTDTKTKKSHPETVQNICEWCQEPFEIIWKNRHHRFCCKSCMYEWRKNKTQKEWLEKTEVVKCSHCTKPFRRDKKGNKYRDGKLQMFCSNECNRSSDYKKEKLREWGLSDANPRKSQAVKDKIKQTKLERYGDENYNNMEKQSETTMEKYGVPYTILLGKSNGHRISNGQRLHYEKIKKDHPDALLEHWIPELQKSVDIYIPSEKTIIEFKGTYWHCDPNKYDADYYNQVKKMTAAEIWQRDADREQEFIDAGYQVVIEWEK